MLTTAPASREIVIKLPRYHTGQADIASDPTRFKVLNCGRRFGKTEMAKIYLCERLIETNLPYAYYANIYKTATDVWDSVNATLHPLIAYRNVQEKRITLITGASLHIWSSENEDSGRGFKYAGVIVDEAAITPKLQYLWDNTIRPTLADYQGWAWIMSMAKQGTYFHELFKSATDKRHDQWQAFTKTIYDNPFIARDEIESIRITTPPDVFEAEYLSEFTSRKGLVYPEWHEDNISLDADFHPDYPVYWAMDDGYTNPRVCLLTQQRPVNGKADRICVFGEYYRSNQLEEQTIQDVLAYGYPAPRLAVIDPSAAQLIARLNQNGIHAYMANNEVRLGINTVRGYMKDGNNERVLLVHPRCEHTIEELSNYRYVDKGIDTTGEPRVVKEADHTCDALRYGILSIWGFRT